MTSQKIKNIIALIQQQLFNLIACRSPLRDQENESTIWIFQSANVTAGNIHGNALFQVSYFYGIV